MGSDSTGAEEMRPGSGIWGQRMGSAAILHIAFLAVNAN